MKKYRLYLKKYKKLIPTLIFPYTMAIFLLLMIFAQQNIILEIIMGYGIDIFLIVILLLPLIGFICNLFMCHQIKKEQWDYLELLEVNLLIKCVQIPAYIVVFLFGVAFLLTIFTFGISIVLIFLDCFSVFLSGMVASTAIKRTVAEGALNKGLAFFLKIGSFIFCLDVIVAIVLYIIGRDKVTDIHVKTLSEENS